VSPRLLAGIATAVVIATIAAAMAALDSPRTARERRFDGRRIDDLNQITMAIDNHVAATGALPSALEALGRLPLNDPATGQPYEYSAHSADRYELCAVFNQPSDAYSPAWRHETGRTCFPRRSREAGAQH
jgi:hypothetical protein